MNGQNVSDLHETLTELKLEHRRLDGEIKELIESVESDQLKISRLKKKKLMLKDKIRQLEDRLLPDIIA